MKIDYQNIIIQIGNENFPKCMRNRIVEIINNNKSDSNISVSLPTMDEAIDGGFYGAKDHPHKDIYYAGWMDCFEWIKNKAE